ncbi:hypothetical protein XELAEV_18021132mg [Xenopus laevis]|uniref:Uncharacterized protein n=1 Tax=Xenopus laevis TaxID=8355 RepID=A0A974HR35_XENLA|nr:hypothetical protein XELAEV_18021132mg [Xenopus laevis]
MVAAVQPMLHQQHHQELWMRRWMAQIHAEIRETRMTIHRGFQDLVAAQPHRPGGSAEGEVAGPPAALPPPPEAPQHRRERGHGRGHGPVRGPWSPGNKPGSPSENQAVHIKFREVATLDVNVGCSI